MARSKRSRSETLHWHLEITDCAYCVCQSVNTAVLYHISDNKSINQVLPKLIIARFTKFTSVAPSCICICTFCGRRLLTLPYTTSQTTFFPGVFMYMTPQPMLLTFNRRGVNVVWHVKSWCPRAYSPSVLGIQCLLLWTCSASEAMFML